MEPMIEIAEWTVWGFALLLGFGFLMNRHRDGGVMMLSRRYAILVLIGALVTLFTNFSKLHLLWWMPVAYLLNTLLLTAIVRSKMKSFEKNLMNADGSQPINEQDGGSAEVDDDEDYRFAKEMLAAYLKVSKQYFMYRVVDESRLPFKKDDLKAAMKLMLYYHDSDSAKEALRESYYLLSKYQPDSETTENLQRLTMEAYEKLIEHDGKDIDEDERLSGLLNAAENNLDLEDTKVVDSERELLVSELRLWELRLELEEAKQELSRYISSLKNDSKQGAEGEAQDRAP